MLQALSALFLSALEPTTPECDRQTAKVALAEYRPVLVADAWLPISLEGTGYRDVNRISGMVPL